MQDRASFTAETVALMRALETARGAGRRLFVDPYAEPFTRGRLRLLARWARLPLVGPAAAWVYDRVAGPGPRPSAAARTRFIDDAVTARAAAVEQVVLLGAGFDTRRVVYVAVDFERDDPSCELVAAGFDPARPSVFVWEGVTNYLTAVAVDATLATIRALAAPGSVLVFTYVDAGVLDGTVLPEAARWLRNVQEAGEAWTFGLRPAEVAGFLARRGFALETDVSTREADGARFAALGRRDVGSDLYHVVVAEVA